MNRGVTEYMPMHFYFFNRKKRDKGDGHERMLLKWNSVFINIVTFWVFRTIISFLERLRGMQYQNHIASRVNVAPWLSVDP